MASGHEWEKMSKYQRKLARRQKEIVSTIETCDVPTAQAVKTSATVAVIPPPPPKPKSEITALRETIANQREEITRLHGRVKELESGSKETALAELNTQCNRKLADLGQKVTDMAKRIGEQRATINGLMDKIRRMEDAGKEADDGEA